MVGWFFSIIAQLHRCRRQRSRMCKRYRVEALSERYGRKTEGKETEDAFEKVFAVIDHGIFDGQGSRRKNGRFK